MNYHCLSGWLCREQVWEPLLRRLPSAPVHFHSSRELAPQWDSDAVVLAHSLGALRLLKRLVAGELPPCKRLILLSATDCLDQRIACQAMLRTLRRAPEALRQNFANACSAPLELFQTPEPEDAEGLIFLRDTDLRGKPLPLPENSILFHGTHDAIIPTPLPQAIRLEGANHIIPFTHADAIADAL